MGRSIQWRRGAQIVGIRTSATAAVTAALPLWALAAMMLLSSVTRAQDLGTKFRVNDSDPSSNIPTIEERNRHPLEFGYFLQDLVARAQGAHHKGDWDNAVKYYEALKKTVPERGISYSKLCSAYAKLGQAEPAIANCREAMVRDGAKVADHTRFLSLILNRKQLDQTAVAEVEASLKHLRQNTMATSPPPKTDATSAQTESAHPGKPARLAVETQIELFDCKLAAIIRNSQRLGQCISALQRQQVEPHVILGFQWSQAVANQDDSELERVLARGKELGLSAVALQKMRSAYATESERSAVSTKAASALAAAGNNGTASDEADNAPSATGEAHSSRLIWIGTAVCALLALGGVTFVRRRRKQPAAA